MLGANYHPQNLNLNKEDNERLMSRFKFTSFRLDYPWSQTEVKKGVFKQISGPLKDTIEISNEKNFTTILILDYGNKAYSIDKPLSDDDIKHFSDYAVWVVKNVKVKKPIYEIWNEWDQKNKKIYSNTISSANEYLKLVKSVSSAIKTVNPDAKVIAGSFNPFNAVQKSWFVHQLNNGLLNYIDGISLHMYSYNYKKIDTPENYIKQIKDIEFKTSKFKKTPIYITEIGLPDYKGVWFNQTDIEIFADSFIKDVDKLDYVKGIWWYELTNSGFNVNNTQDNYGILDKELKEKEIFKSFKRNNNG